MGDDRLGSAALTSLFSDTDNCVEPAPPTHTYGETDGLIIHCWQVPVRSLSMIGCEIPDRFSCHYQSLTDNNNVLHCACVPLRFSISARPGQANSWRIVTLPWPWQSAVVTLLRGVKLDLLTSLTLSSRHVFISGFIGPRTFQICHSYRFVFVTSQ